MGRRNQRSKWISNTGSIDIRLVGGGFSPPVLFEATREVGWADEHFAAVLDISQRLAQLLVHFEESGVRYCVFGGWLRDTLAAHAYGTPGPRDVDLVAADIDLDALIRALPADISPTMFGGVQSSAGPIPFDIWPLHETFLIRTLCMPVSFDSLLQTADFNINAALYFPAQAGQASAILDAGMLDALQRRCLSFNASHLPFPIMQCSRILAYGAKLNLRLDDGVYALVREALKDSHCRAQVIEGLRNYQLPNIAEKAIQSILSIFASER